MARYSAGMTAAGAGTTLRPIFGILCTASTTPKLREVGLFNTTNTACVFELIEITGGTPGATVTAFAHDSEVPATPANLAKQLWTADGGSPRKTGYRISCGGAIGSGAILSFGDSGVRPLLGSTIALGLVPIGTGQVCEVYMVWDE